MYRPAAVYALFKCGSKTFPPTSEEPGTPSPHAHSLQRQHANGRTPSPPWTWRYVYINTHSAWSGHLHHHPAFQQTPEVLPQGRRPKQPHAYGTATHALLMCPQRQYARVLVLRWRRHCSTLHMSGSVPTKDMGLNEANLRCTCLFSVCVTMQF